VAVLRRTYKIVVGNLKNETENTEDFTIRGRAVGKEV
jgi:hypothetical protein